jgi:hypothetical protein
MEPHSDFSERTQLKFERQMWNLRIPRSLWRIAGQSLCTDRRPVCRGALLHLETKITAREGSYKLPLDHWLATKLLAQ